MKKMLFKSLVFVCLILSATACSNTNGTSTDNQDSNEVLICEGENAYAYHEHECQGFNECEASSEWVSIDEAQNMGRTPCGYCY